MCRALRIGHLQIWRARWREDSKRGGYNHDPGGTATLRAEAATVRQRGEEEPEMSVGSRRDRLCDPQEGWWKGLGRWSGLGLG